MLVKLRVRAMAQIHDFGASAVGFDNAVHHTCVRSYFVTAHKKHKMH